VTRDFNHIQRWLDPKLKQMGLSVERFARLSDLSRSAVYFYRNDQDRPTEETMARMCRVLGVPLCEGLSQYTPKRNGRPTNPR
jgi:transcriptional regulator with XRE-family HTH domain